MSARADPPPSVADARPWGPQQGGLIKRALEGGARLLGRGAPPQPEAPPRAEPPAVAEAPPVLLVAPAGPDPAERRAWADRLWGEGLCLPGGAAELLRLSALLPLTPDATLLLAGDGARAAGGIVSGARGCFVSAFDPLAEPPSAAPKPGRKVTAAPFDPAAPAFRARYHNHAMLLEPFRGGGSPAALLAATAAGLRAGGQLVLLDLVVRDAPAAGRWLEAECRRAPPPEAEIPRALAAAGFQVNVVEDAGPRHRRAVMEAWAALTEALRGEATRPTPAAARAMVEEAEAWLLRLRLLEQGRLRLLRWHATMARAPS
ncbi:hypothetical protein J5Y09_01275 [Roseomonas sp. PWR1]|uniref:Methyltransferase domain-containing protein n=1 Tax=Roseomonas nitratireducens TaxID=2820810 RepID=A0ABS4AME4_9PROT|nr:hypothetical protein [Neoroseomonas nitratireducens]MBP0462529.1 hypothetical protein [Neoroseomonas nitratireducens]